MAGHNEQGYRTDVRRDPKDRKFFVWTLSKLDEPIERGREPLESLARKALRAAIAAYLERKKLPPKVAPINLYE